MPTYAIPPKGCAGYLTAGKRYEVLREKGDGFYITDDDGDEIYCRWSECPYLIGGDWTREEVTQDDAETLRDRFAMAALTGLLAHPRPDADNWSWKTGTITGDAYMFADAMMIARRNV